MAGGKGEQTLSNLYLYALTTEIKLELLKILLGIEEDDTYTLENTKEDVQNIIKLLDQQSL
jgi:hypothetical protein